MNAICDHEVGWQVKRIPLAAIIVDAAIQQRAAGTSKDVVADYAEAMRDGVAFPPIDVFGNEDGAVYLANGFHRLLAYQSANPDAEDIECRVHPGTRDDALLFACGANAKHGLRRSRSDKMKAVTTLLSSETWLGWSDREIARQCGVSHGFVAAIRRDHLDTLPDAGRAEEAGAADAAPALDRPRTVRRGGQHYHMNTAHIGRGQPSDEVTSLDRTFRRFERALRSASEPARQAFLEQYRDEIIALTQAAAPPIAVAPNSADLASSTALLARAHAEGGGVGHE
jgi:hypothetical protein